MNLAQKRQIEKLRSDGHGYAAIASALGLSKHQVSGYCRRQGINGKQGRAGVSNALVSDVCLECATPITQKEGVKRRKFCSKDCKQKWWNAHLYQVNKRTFYEITCSHCGLVFSSYGNSTRKFCSHACYIASRFGKAVCHD